MRLPSRPTVAAFAAAGATAAVVAARAKAAEHSHPPHGRFIVVGDLPIHYVDRGSGTSLVLLHGNGSMIQDFEISRLLDFAARRYRVIAFDRPGFGHTPRPRSIIWTAAAQADLLAHALGQLGTGPAIVLGHSWGASVAIALADRYPDLVRSLVLASGYYFPTARLDVPMLAPPALPVVGDVLRYTVSPVLAHLLWPGILRKIFGPAEVTREFESHFPKELALRPSQLRAAAEESALMIPGALAMRGRYAQLTRALVIVTGEADRIVDKDRQARRLFKESRAGRLIEVPGAGHMVHHTAPTSVMQAIDSAAA